MVILPQEPKNENNYLGGDSNEHSYYQCRLFFPEVSADEP